MTIPVKSSARRIEQLPGILNAAFFLSRRVAIVASIPKGMAQPSPMSIPLGTTTMPVSDIVQPLLLSASRS